MMRDRVTKTASNAVRTMDDLLAPFYAAETAREGWRVGTESEKFAVDARGAPLPFEGSRSVSAVLSALQTRFGWSAYQEYSDGPVIALRRDRARGPRRLPTAQLSGPSCRATSCD